MKKLVFLFVFLFCLPGSLLAQTYEEGTDYDSISQQATESGDKVEVLEFFWYGCPHCYVFDPILSKWLESKPENVEFVRVPVVFRPEWKVHGRAYYALQVMGLGEKFHSDIFNEIHKNRNRLDTEESITDFLVSKGVDKKGFQEAYNSFTVDNDLRKAIKMLQAYNIRGVPTMAVNGKYVVSGTKAKSYENMLRILDFLIKKESAAAQNTTTK